MTQLHLAEKKFKRKAKHWHPRPILFLLFFYWYLLYPVRAQDVRPWSLNGYNSFMPQMMWSSMHFDTLSDFERAHQYLLHNRLNLYWTPKGKISGSLQFRNQIMVGDFTNGVENGFQTDNYYLPLSFYQNFGSEGLISLTADRAWLQYSHKQTEITLGRQRINWGQTFVWYPNDIFNTYNFFDFDYAERPGADALRVIYYTGQTSVAEIAAKLDSAANITSAALFRFNYRGKDIQLMSGYYSQPAMVNPGTAIDADWVAGLGATGDYRGMSIRTEMSFFHPLEGSSNKENLFLISTGLDATFKNEIFASAEFFYASRIVNTTTAKLNNLYNAPLTVKNLAWAKYNMLVQGSYPVTPLIKTSLSCMLFTDETITGYFVGPSIDLSLLDELDLALYFQFFRTRQAFNPSDLKTLTRFVFLRIKWSF